MHKVLKMVVMGICLASLSGCATRLVDFTVISTKNVQVAKAKGDRVKGSDCAFLGQANIKEAIDRAIETAGGDYDALVDGVMYHRGYPFVNCIEVEGTPVNTKSKTSMQGIDKKDLMLHSSRTTERNTYNN